MSTCHRPMSFVKAQFVITPNGGAEYHATVIDWEKQKQTGPDFISPNPYTALAHLCRSLCRNCLKVERKHGEKYCQPCSVVILDRLNRIGYLTRVPPPTKRSGPSFLAHVSAERWDDIVSAYEHALDDDE